MGLYRAMVRARCALVCLKAGETPPVDTAGASRFRLRSEPPSLAPRRPGTSSPKRAILCGAKTEKSKPGAKKVRLLPHSELQISIQTERVSPAMTNDELLNDR